MKLLVLLALCLSFGKAFATDSPIEELPDQCQKFIEEKLKPNNWQWGTLEVPFDWNSPASKEKIKIFYYHSPAPSLKKATPLIFLNGGPFFSYQSKMIAIDDSLKKYSTTNSNRIVIMMDQRGTGCSSPDQNLAKKPYEVIQKYKSPSIVKDAEALRKHLYGNQKWDILGNSYGGFLTLRYMKLFPKSIQNIFLHAPTLHSSMADFFMYRILEQEKVLDQFISWAENNGFKNLEKIFEKMNRERQEYCIDVAPNGKNLCGRVLLDSILASIGRGKGRSVESDEIWTQIAESLTLFLNSKPKGSDGNYIKFLEIAKNKLAWFESDGIIISASMWANELKFVNGDYDFDCIQAYQKLESEYNILKSQIRLDECRIILDATRDDLNSLHREHYQKSKGKDRITQQDTLAMLNKSPLQNSNFVVFTGQLNTFAQPSALSTLLQSQRVHHIVLENSGHDGYMFEKQIWEVILSQ